MVGGCLSVIHVISQESVALFIHMFLPCTQQFFVDVLKHVQGC